MTRPHHEIGSDIPPRAPEVEPPAIPVFQAGGSANLPEALPGHWDTEDGRDKASEYVAMPRDRLIRGELSDLALANRQFLAGRYDLDLVVWQTAAKERIRWLSVQLAIANAKASGQ